MTTKKVDWSGWNLGTQHDMYLADESGGSLAEIDDLQIVEGSRMYRAMRRLSNGTEHVKQFRSLAKAMSWCEGEGEES